MDDTQNPVIDVISIGDNINGFFKNHSGQIHSGFFTQRLAGLFGILSGLGSINTHQADLYDTVLVFNLYGISAVDANDFVLTRKTER
jgi:hypothetical protein